MLQAKLLDQDSPYGAVSIVGMPGLGKTTLAKKLYRHIRDQFECSGLVYISQQPRVGEILLDIAKQVGLPEGERKDNLESNLRSLLKIKRYVILLDDIWDIEIWDDLKLVLPECDSKMGSRIIITSRNSDKISNFDNDDWANTSPDLVNIVRNIVGRCGGIPLAIVVTAGMLRARERTEHAWSRVLESMSHIIQDKCAKVLALSYNDLSYTLRPCFLYFGLYPEDHEILAFDLKNMWIAEKLIVVNNGNRREAEDLAEDVLNDLVSRNLIQVAERTYDGRISSCRIHDLLHSLCVDLAKESNFFHTKHNAFGDPNNVARVRRITFYSSNVMNAFICSNPKPKKLRALFCFTKDPCILSLMAHIGFKFLQVLVIVMPQNENQQLTTIPIKIGDMSCLRYLRLEGGISGELPSSIVKVKHLETLDVRKSSVTIPSGVCKSKQLRHLRDRGFRHAPSNMYSLPNNLQTLMWMHDKFFRPIFSHQLINLRKLGIIVVSNSTIRILSVSSPMMPNTLEVLKLRLAGLTSEQINLSSYQNIVKLHLCELQIDSTDSVAFPPNLVKLTLVDHPVDSQLLAVLKKLPKLRILKMDHCKYNERRWISLATPMVIAFPNLKFCIFNIHFCCLK
ncbi:hypothetical protein P3S68_023830 [Capsicum galapagoense]